MVRKEILERFEYVRWLIERKATGGPKELATTLNISERSLYRLLDDFRSVYRLRIKFSRQLNSYIIKPDAEKR